MAYVPQNFYSGQKLTDEHLKHMEAGIATADANAERAIKAVQDAITMTPGATTTAKGRFYGKIANFLGDSQTDNAGNYKSVFFYDWLKDILGLSKTNSYGYSGTTIMPISGQNKSFLERYTSMDANADLIVVWGGTNDYHYGHALGNVDDTVNTTFCGALNQLCKGLINKYPGKDILFVTPTPRGVISSAVAPLSDYADAIINVCAKYCIPVYDAFRKCNMPINYEYPRRYTVDGLHLNDLGHEVLGKSMANFILYSEMAGCRAAWGEAENGGEDDTGGGGNGDSGDSGETEVTLIRITATYSGGDVPVGTAVTSLTGIVVTATYSDGSTAPVTGYTLSGSISEGSNTITVRYGGLTTTFTVTGFVEAVAPASPVDGKTVTFTAQASYPACSNFVLLVDADDFGNTNGDQFEFTMKYRNATKTLTGFTNGMDTFGDDSGEVSNGVYKSPGLTGYISTTVSDGTVTASFKRNATANSYPYAKVSIPIVMGAYPVSFDVESVTLKKNGEYIPIQKIGSFYAQEGFSVSGENTGGDSGDDTTGGEEVTAPTSPVDGKNVTFTSACVHTTDQSNLILLVDADDLPDANGEVVIRAEIANQTQTINGVDHGMATYQDETGEVGNNAFKTPTAASAATVTFDNNVLVSQTNFTASNVQYPYVKFLLTFKPNAYPVSFDVISLTLSIGGQYIPIQKVGAFTANEGYSEA